MDNYYRNIWLRPLHVITLLVGVVIRPESRQILWINNMEVNLQDLKKMVSAKTLLTETNWKIQFTVRIDASNWQLRDVFKKKTEHHPAPTQKQ